MTQILSIPNRAAGVVVLAREWLDLRASATLEAEHIIQHQRGEAP